MSSRDFNPFDMFRQLEQELRSSSGSAIRGMMFHPSVDMYETPDDLVVKLEVAGVRPDRINIELSADDRYLTVEGERAETQADHRDRVRCYHLEIYYGEFRREIALPGNLRIERDRIRASYRDGFLLITLPKRLGETAEKRTIPVTNE
ncbi:MAG TPA: Hsp20/alpha crystallin family protein [Chthonomonadaceae bacterium]|nr:Hsp20/alpha crystallin family protein [Chthonomonadaceae bacterium]